MLASQEQGCGIIQLRRSDEARPWYVDSPPPSSLWQLTFRDDSGKEVTVSNTQGGKISVVAEPRQVTIHWQSVPIARRADCDVKVVFTARDERLEGTIAVQNNAPNHRLWAVDFPIMTLRATPSAPEVVTLVFARDTGRSWRNPFEGPRGYLMGAAEPTGISPHMQFGTIYDDAGRGLYWATHDPQCHSKRFFYTSEPAAKTVCL